MEDSLEKVGLAPAEPGEWQIRVADERAQNPAHLRTHQGKHDHPEPEDRFDMLAHDAVLERIERTGGPRHHGVFEPAPAATPNPVRSIRRSTAARCSSAAELGTCRDSRMLSRCSVCIKNDSPSTPDTPQTTTLKRSMNG